MEIWCLKFCAWKAQRKTCKFDREKLLQIDDLDNDSEGLQSEKTQENLKVKARIMKLATGLSRQKKNVFS